MARTPALLGDVAQTILDCACEALVDDGIVPADCCDPDGDDFRAFIAQGEVAWDGCCVPCGQLSVRLVRLFESDRKPDQAIGPHSCSRVLIAEWEILRLVCVTVAENAEAQPPILPFPATISTEGREMLSSLYSLWTGLSCCFAEWNRDHGTDVEGWHVDAQIVGPQGGCAGAELRIQTLVGSSCDCGHPAPPAPIP